MQLSKSLYVRGLQCKKALWLKKYKDEVLTPPDDSAKNIFETGNKVGDLACQLFPNGKEIPYENTTFDEKIALTKQWIDEGLKNIYEASFSLDDIFIMVDILHINDDNSVEIYEVKSSTKVKDVYLDDVSIQYYVLNGLGFNVKKASIIHINNEYIRGDELEIEKLFKIIDVTNEIIKLQNNISLNLKEFKKVLSDNKNEPKIDIGMQCDNPYKCDAKAYCWKDIPEYSIFDISRINKDKKFEFYKQGIVEINQIEDLESFSENQQIQIISEKTQKEIINKEEILKFLDTLTYPIYYLDFETFQQAIPQWKGIKPFMQIPFQYSLHIEYSDGKLEHKEFLAESAKDPREELANKLIQDIPTDVTVLAYNMGFEKGVIKKLATQFPNLSESLMKIHDNIKDLMIPFQKKYYYTTKMKGSYSIKYILPALIPEMEEAYKNLDLIHNGGEAMQSYSNMITMNDEEKKEYRKALLKYCELDTYAMVKILNKLKECVI
jgi:hypothetical protein